jgi:hypothetical protein
MADQKHRRVGEGVVTFEMGVELSSGSIAASGYGSIASGFTTGSGADITGSGNGSFAHGYSARNAAYGAADITASGDGSIALGYTKAGIFHNPKIESSNLGSFAVGYGTGSYGQVISSGIGSFASGDANAQKITASGDGSFAQGNVAGSGSITASGDGSHASGYTSSGSIRASNIGATAIGRCAAFSGDIYSRGAGCFAGGNAEGSGSTIIAGTAGSIGGAFSHGSVYGGGDLLASGEGSAAFGYVFSTDATITSGGKGSFVNGYARTQTANGVTSLTSTGDGSHASGVVHITATATDSHHAYLRSTSIGSFATGYAQQTTGSSATNSLIESTDHGAFVSGKAVNGGQVRAISDGASAFGYATTDGAITSSGYGSHAGGYTTGETLTSTGIGSFAWGEGPITASGDHSFAIGSGSLAALDGEFAHSNTEFAAVGDAQFSRVVMSVSTVDGTSEELTTDGSTTASAANRYLISDEHSYDCWIRISARQDTGAGHAEFVRKLIIERTGGTTALVGSVQTIGTDIGSNGGSPPASWAVSLTADDTNDFLDITVTGVAATNIRWVATVEAIVIGYAN